MNVLAHNLLAMNAQRQFNIVTDRNKKTTEKLSSGFKINRAADDAAGLTISENMRRQVRGLTQAGNNCQDGISYVQTADGALDEVQQMLHRMTELSIKAANGTNTAEDRGAINEEINELKSEIDRVFTTTEFNKQPIWGADYSRPIEVGQRHDTYDYPAVTFNETNNYSTINDMNKGAVPRSYFNLSADDDGIKVSWKGFNGKDYESDVIPWDDPITGSHSFKLSDHMDYSAYPDAAGLDFNYSYNVHRLSELDDVKAAINGSYVNNYETVPVQIGINDTGSSYMSASGANVSLSVELDYDAQLVSGKSFTARDTSFTGIGSVANPALLANPDSDNFEFSFSMPGIGTVRSSVTSARFTGDYNSNINDHTGENLWWQYYTYNYNGHIEKYKTSLIHDADPDNGSFDAIKNAITDGDEDIDSLWTNNEYKSGTYIFEMNLKSDSSYTRQDGAKTNNVGSMTMRIELNGSSFASESDFIDAVRASLSDITSFKVYDNDDVNKSQMRAYRYSHNSSNKVSETIDTPIYEYPVDPTKGFIIQANAEGSDNQINIEYDNMTLGLLGIQDMDVLTQDNARSAIGLVNTALDKVSKERSVFGAYQNRLEHAYANDMNTAENTQAAESKIRDTDMAKTMVEYSRDNILQQAGQAMITQANQTNQGILSLLQ